MGYRIYDFLDHPLPLAFAHRGGDTDGLENSMVAFERAIALGYRYLETDVRATSDGVLLVFHDSILQRVTDHHGRVAELPYREVVHARIAGTEPIPLLTELLGTFPDARVNIDVKHAQAVEPLITALRHTNAINRVCVASFSDRRLAAVRAALGPGLCTSLGPREVTQLRTASVGWWLRCLSPRGIPCVQIPPWIWLLDARLVEHAHARSMQIHAWTVNDENEMRRLLDLGVDGIVTDELETLRQILQERGEWHT